VLDRTDDLATRKSFRTLFSIQVRLESLVALLYTDEVIRQALLIVTTMLITASSVLNLQAKRGLPILNQLSGWTVLGIDHLLHHCCPSDLC